MRGAAAAEEEEEEEEESGEIWKLRGPSLPCFPHIISPRLDRKRKKRRRGASQIRNNGTQKWRGSPSVIGPLKKCGIVGFWRGGRRSIKTRGVRLWPCFRKR